MNAAMTDEPKQIDSELAALITTLDENPDELHLDITPSVLKLISLGLQGADAALDLLNAPTLETRLRARRVLEGAVGAHVGWKPGQGFPNKVAEKEFHDLVAKNGNYSAHAPEDERKEAIRKWREWLRWEQEKKQ